MNMKILYIFIAIVVGYGVYTLTIRNTAPSVVQTPTVTDNVDVKKNASIEPVADGSYRVETDTSIIRWTGKKTVIVDYEDEGTIRLTQGMFEVKDGNATGNIVVDMTSIKAEKTGRLTGESSLERHLKSKDFFEVEKYPSAEFRIMSTTVLTGSDSENNYRVTGELVMKEKTEKVEFDARGYMDGDTLRLNADFEIDRTKWDVRYGSGKFFENLADNVIGDMIGLSLDIFATKIVE